VEPALAVARSPYSAVGQIFPFDRNGDPVTIVTTLAQMLACTQTCAWVDRQGFLHFKMVAVPREITSLGGSAWDDQRAEFANARESIEVCLTPTCEATIPTPAAQLTPTSMTRGCDPDMSLRILPGAFSTMMIPLNSFKTYLSIPRNYTVFFPGIGVLAPAISVNRSDVLAGAPSDSVDAEDPAPPNACMATGISPPGPSARSDFIVSGPFSTCVMAGMNATTGDRIGWIVPDGLTFYADSSDRLNAMLRYNTPINVTSADLSISRFQSDTYEPFLLLAPGWNLLVYPAGNFKGALTTIAGPAWAEVPLPVGSFRLVRTAVPIIEVL
jgi:hypothetical protein